MSADSDPRRHNTPDSLVDEIIMAIDMRDKATIGCAYFNTADGVLSLSDDVSMGSMDVVEQLLVHVEPTTLLVSGRAPEGFMEFLQERSQSPQAGMSLAAGELRTDRVHG